MTNGELCIRVQEGNQEAMAELWDSLYRFTYQQSYRFYTSSKERCVSAGVTVDDLIQYAYIVMVKAVELYKPDTYKFISYFGKALLYGYLRLISRNQDKALNNAISFDKSLDDEEGDCLLDIIADPDGEADMDNVIESEYQRELQRDVKAVLDTLSDDERNVLHERFWNSKTLQATADTHGMTAQEAQSIESKAFRCLRSPKAMKYLNAYHRDIIDRHAYNSSLSAWKHTHTSSTERTVIELEKQGL